MRPKNPPKEDPKKIARRPRSLKRSKGPRDSCYLNCQVIQIAKTSKLLKGLRVQESKGSLKRSQGPRDPCRPSFQEIQVSKSFLEKSTLLEPELFLTVAFLEL